MMGESETGHRLWAICFCHGRRCKTNPLRGVRGSRPEVSAVLKAAASLILLIFGSYFIYGFGAGYFSMFGLWLPSPWNFVATGILSVGLLGLIVSFWWSSPKS